MNTKIVILTLLLAVVIFSGCIDINVPPEETHEDTPIDIQQDEEQPDEVQIEENVNETPAYAIVDKTKIGDGLNPALEVYNETLFIFREKYAGNNYDIYYNTYDGSLGDKVHVEGTIKDDKYPSTTVFEEKLYLFTTEIASETSTNNLITYKTYDGKWGDAQKIDHMEYDTYTKTVAGVYNHDLYMLFSQGLKNQEGKIKSRRLSSAWVGGPMNTQSIASEKNPAIVIEGGKLHMLYESYYSEKNEIFHRYYYDGKWQKAQQITNSEKPAYKTTGDIEIFEGKLHATWYTDGEIYLSTYEAGIWSSATQLTSNDYSDETPSLEVYDGKLYIAWVSQKEPAPYVYLGVIE
ncbi:MAG: hypothetical protein ABIG20_03975 [archaeon]